MFIKLSLEPLLQRRYLLSKFAKEEKSGRRARHASLLVFFLLQHLIGLIAVPDTGPINLLI